MKTTKRLLSVLFALVLLCVSVPFAVQAEEEIVASGEFQLYKYSPQSDQYALKWTINNEGTMEIHGESKVVEVSTKWDEYSEIIKTIIISDDVDWLPNQFYNEFAYEHELHEGVTNTNLINLERYIVDENNSNYSSDDNGCLLSKDMSTLISYPAGRRNDSFTIPAYVTTLSRASFVQCEYLKELIIPASVTVCEKCTVACCHNLETLRVNEAAGHSVDGFTYECSVKNWVLGADVQTINKYDPYEFAENIFVDENNPYYQAVDGVLFSKDLCRLIKYPGGKAWSDYSIPSYVETIGREAFSFSLNLRKVIMPNGLKKIEKMAFGASGIKSIIIPKTVESIGEYAFVDCFLLKEINIGGVNTSLERDLFGVEATIPNATEDELILLLRAFIGYTIGQDDEMDDLLSRIVYPNYENGENYFYVGTIYCHTGSTAETYAQETGMNCETVHYCETFITSAEPTCTEQGYSTYQCIYCDTTENRDYIDPVGHDYIDHVAQAPTCTEIGWDAYQTCSRCDYTSYLEKNSLGHDYIDHAAQEATCTGIGWDAYQTCSQCGYSTYEEISPLGHIEKTYYSEPTCTKAGYNLVVCTRCGNELSSEFLPQLDHNYSSVVTTKATCKTPGVRTYTCSGCGDTYTEEIPIDPTAHDMQIGSCVLETCTTDGYTPWFCTRCGHEIRTDIVSAPGHAWDDGITTLEPTCSTTGTILFTCKRDGCGARMEKEIPIKPDAHVFIVTVTPPTCIDDGYTTHACTLCRYGYSDEIVAALGHDYVNAKATGNGDGTHTLTCNRCKQPGEAIACADEGNDGNCDTCGDQMQGGDHCKYCGRIHNGNFFDKLTGFFHKIFAVFKR